MIYKSFSPAGGARAKAIVGYSKKENTFCIGKLCDYKKFTPSIIKFDERIIGKTYSLALNEFIMMSTARHIGINTPNFYLSKDGKFTHFVIERFDIKNGFKLHRATISSLNDYNFKDKSYGYDHVFRTMEKMQLKKEDFSQMFKRMIFNFVYNNHDDHLKNHSLLMNKEGEWSLSPAYDITYLKAAGHMSNWLKINGKSSKFVEYNDFKEIAKRHDIKNYNQIIKDVENGVDYFKKMIKCHISKTIEGEMMLTELNYIQKS
jgi:serine/threonine-protein kinase HipA